MSFLIGGFSSAQYKSYLQPAPEQKQNGNRSHWVAHFHLASYPTLAVLVNRIAYFLLHRFAVYPNNTYLFQKFKSHDFTQIATEAQYAIAMEILKRFQSCSELDQVELNDVEDRLNDVEEHLKKEDDPIENKENEKVDEKKKLEDVEAVQKQKKAKEKTVEKKKLEEAEAAEEKTTSKPSTSREAARAKKKEARAEAGKKAKIEETKKNEKDQQAEKAKEIENANKEDEPKKLGGDVGNSSSGDLFDPQDDEKPESKDKQNQKKDLEKKKSDKELLINSELKIKDQEKSDKALKSKGKEVLVDNLVLDDSLAFLNESFLSLPPEDNSNPIYELSKSNITLERLSNFFDDLSKSQIGNLSKSQIGNIGIGDIKIDNDEDLWAIDEDLKDEDAEEWSVISLPTEIDDILNQPFPLIDSESINDLFQEKNSANKLPLYRDNLQTLIRFANQLHAEKSKVKDDRFEEYMKKVNDAFQRAWEEAYQQADVLWAEFSKIPSQKTLLLNSEGEIVCTVAQSQWLAKTIAERFPAIYRLAFDAPSLEIYQSHQMASLARAIAIGKNANYQAAELNSPCFIRIQESVGKSTPVVQDDSKTNPLLKAGNFIFTCFVGASGKIEQEVGKLKQQLQGLAKAYVKNWLEQPGITLKFDDIVIKGGQTSEAIAASGWVADVRNVYTNTLKNMDQKSLQEEIKKTMQCPFVKMIAKIYVNDIDAKAWTTSRFPMDLMKQLFSEELKRTKGSSFYKAIDQMIDESQFANEQDIMDLAKTANCGLDLIEPLIRIRVLYMICCLGQNVIDPAVQSINQRAETMYDPSVCEDVDDPILICTSGKRTVSFDTTFDQLTMKITTTFKDPHKINAVAQGKTTFTVDSLSLLKGQEVETEITDLEKLRFSIYSSPEQTRYLVAQVDPKTLSANVKKLEQEIPTLALIKKAKRYEIAKTNHNNNRGYGDRFWGTNLFDPKAYQEFDSDSQHLDEAIGKATELVTYLNTEQMLAYSGQLTEQADNMLIKPAIAQIRNEFKKISTLLGEIYVVGNLSDKKWNDICEKSKRLQELLEINSEGVEVFDREIDSDSSAIPSSDPSDGEIEEEDVIGRATGIAQKTFTNHIWDNTFGFFFNETEQVKYLRWKIERYEDLIKGVQDGIIKYLTEKELGDVKSLLKKAKQVSAAEWMKKLLPILEFSRKSLRSDDQRLNPDYLKEVRDSYDMDIIKLREAATWAKEHSTMPGVEHINAICYQLYATLDLNHRCRAIFNTFLKLGREALSKASEHSLLIDPHYAMLTGLYEANKLINAVPNDAKAPALKQWANSLRGHMNGVLGVTTFDPNLQSNPMHVFFNKIIKKKGEGDDVEVLEVKDIAMGSPTIESGSGAAEINPEFEGFLRHCKKLGLKHLYINNQNFTATSWVKGNESSRCQALHDLAENDFKDTLFVITLNQNTTFYQQRYEFNKTTYTLNGIKEEPEMNVQNVKDALIKDLLIGKSKDYLPAHLIVNPDLHQWMAARIDQIHQEKFKSCDEFADEIVREKFIQDFHNDLRQYVEKSLKAFPAEDGKGLGYSIYYPGAKLFKDELFAQLFDRKPIESGNYIPNDLVDRLCLRDWSLAAIDLIHKDLFGGRQNLSIQERRIFIRIVYQNLAQKVLIETGANSYNASCKDRIDRGAATDAEDFAYLAVLRNYMNDKHVIEFFKMLIFARAIIVRKRTIIEERLERLIESVKFMIDNQKQLQKLNNALFPGIEMTIDQFERSESEGDLVVEDASVLDS